MLCVHLYTCRNVQFNIFSGSLNFSIEPKRNVKHSNQFLLCILPILNALYVIFDRFVIFGVKQIFRPYSYLKHTAGKDGGVFKGRPQLQLILLHRVRGVRKNPEYYYPPATSVSTFKSPK